MRRWEGRSVSLIEWVWPETAKTSWFIVEAKKKKKKKKKNQNFVNTAELFLKAGYDGSIEIHEC